MIVLLVIGALLLAGITLWIIAHFCWWFAAELGGAIMTLLFGAFLLISVVALVFAYTTADATAAQNRTRYESLVYQWNNDFYETENEIGKAQLVDQIRKWNEELAANKKLQRNVWIGAFIPNIYDEFEFIPLEKGGEG